MSNILYLLEVAIALGLIIFVHELGHFLSAKWCGVRVRRFAIGMGHPILKWGRGETEYSLRWIPVGGFVDLAGEHPESEDAEDSKALWRRPAWQRTIIFSAGVVMNAVLAFVLFAAAPIVGIRVPVPVVGGVVAGMPAEKAGLKPGDRILRINGGRVDSFEDLIWTIALKPAGTSFGMDVERPVEGADKPERLSVTMVSERAPGSMAPFVGIEPELEPVVAKMAPDAILQQAGLQEGDRILAVNANAVKTWRGLEKALAEAPAGPVVLSVDRGGVPQDCRVVPADLKAYDYGMTWPTEIAVVETKSPAAEAGLRPGDRVAAIEGKPWPAADTIAEAVKTARAAVRLTLWRKGEFVEVVCTPAVLPGKDYPRIGIAMGPAFGDPVQVGPVEAGGAADQAGLRPGDFIQMAGEEGRKPRSWSDLSDVFLAERGKPVPLQVERGGNLLATQIEPMAVPQERLTLAGAVGSPKYAPLPRLYNPLAAAKRGLKRTGLWLGRVYANLSQLATREVSSKAIGGPVAIVQWSMGVAAHGVGTLMDFWGMLSVSIAVLNFLPIPPFDGGHVLFVLVEKVKGSPIGLRLRTIIWGAGWAAVGALFLLVMWQDIVRLFS